MTEGAPGIVVTVGEDGVQRILIDRPDVGNSLSPLARDALTDAFVRADSDPAVRAVLLSAAGTRHFSAGAGLASRPADGDPQPVPEKRPGDIARMLQHGWQRLVSSVLDCDKPVVAAVNGTAVGAGASLVLACDLVVMSTQATLVEAFVHRGILPDSGAIHLLTRIVGLRKAAELLMLGEPVDAITCERLGLVNRLAAPEQVLSVSSESGRDRAFEQEAWAAEVVSRTEDLQEGLRAFAERRKPRFQGF
jgi:2-(1,2-epoxy-1,2-dihydrophenyl)acetyl-CoA isomerase